MRNRPLCSVCLTVFLLLCISMLAGGDRFFRVSVPPGLEKQAGKEIQITGQVYQIEIKESYQILYLKYLKEQSKVIVYDQRKQPVQIGNQVKARGELSFFEEARNPGNFDQKFYYEKQGICASLWADDLTIVKKERKILRQKLYEIRKRWNGLLVESMGERDGAVLSAILLGEKNGMDPKIKELYQACGIAHVLAISGLHLSLIGIGMYRIFQRLTGSYQAGGIAGILWLLGYILMIGVTVSALRALVMFLFRVGADMSGRKYDSPTALAAASVVVLLWRPLMLYDGGFWLSFGAVLAIIIILPIFNHLPFQPVFASFCVNAMITPVLMYFFYELPLYGVLLNLAVIPLLSVLVAAGLAGSFFGLFWEGAGKTVLLCCKIIFSFYEKGCELTLCLPGARMITGRPGLWQMVCYYVLLFGAVLAARYLKRSGKKKQILLAGMLAGVGSLLLFADVRKKEELSVTILDVGQGDSAFIRGPMGKTYLVDGGSSDVKKVGEYRIEPYLLSQGIGTLDYVFVSHGDKDHISGIEEMIKRKKTGVLIKNLVFPDQSVWDEALWSLAETGKRAKIPVLVMKEGDALCDGDMTLACVQPGAEEGLEAGNSASMVLALKYRSFDMLFTGDVEGKGEEYLVNRLQKEEKKQTWEVLKVAHHGSKNSTNEAFLSEMSPGYALISAGRDNFYGHPHKDTLKRLEQSECIVYSTQRHGALSLQVSGEEFWISGFK